VRRAAAFVGVAILAGCGASDEPQSEPEPTTATATATIRFEHALDPDAPMYIEGRSTTSR
jgi:hypothetical protein